MPATTRRKKTARAKTTRRPAAKRPSKRSKTKAKGLSLHVGLNSVDPKHYAGWSGDLMACENDAKDMATIAESKGIVPTMLLTREATRSRVLAAIRSAAKRLQPGDLFFATYSGHGGQVKDSDADELDRRDETWCLFDAQLIDDEIYVELSKFRKGVRILVLSDSCHSGSVVRAAFVEATAGAAANGARPKWMPRVIADKTYEAHKRFYDQLQRAAARVGRDKFVDPDAALADVSVADRVSAVVKNFPPAVILISGCQDNQTSLDGDRNGAFTEQVLRVWNRGAFSGSYVRFHARIKAGMHPTQTPNLFTLGSTTAFLAQDPFQVSPGRASRATVETAREFVKRAPLPAPRSRAGRGPRTRAAALETTPTLALDAAKTQTAVVGSEIVSFVTGVTAERREAIINSSLLAQLAATKKVPDAARVYDWYNAYFDVLTNVGWVVQDKGFAEYKESGTDFETHKAILAVASVALGAAPTALAIVTQTLQSLQSMNESRPWITIFDRESRRARTARFQISVAEQDPDGQFFVNLLAFGLEAKSDVTQVLFFKVRKEKAKLRHYSGRVTINSAVLGGVADVIKAKLVDHARDFVSQLPDL
jgi:metacaspase-1